MLTVSAKPGERVTPTGAVFVSTIRTCRRDRRDRVGRALQMDVLVGLHPAGAADQIGAEIGVAADAQRQEAALGVQRQFRLGLMVARLVVG